MSKRLIKYTLTAARRGSHERGAVITTPEGSPADLRLRGDPAWARTVTPVVVGEPGPPADVKAQQLYRRLHQFLQEQAAAVADCKPEQIEGYARLVAANRDGLEPFVERAFPFVPEVHDPAPPYRGDEDRGDFDEDEADELVTPPADPPAPEGDEDDLPPEAGTPKGDPTPPVVEPDAEALAAALSLFEAVIGESDTTSTIANMVEAAAAAGVDVPDTLPRKRVDVADVLHELASAKLTAITPDPSDLGD